MSDTDNQVEPSQVEGAEVPADKIDPLASEVKITNGYVRIASQATRRAKKAYNRTLLDGVSVGQHVEDMEITVNNADAAEEALVLALATGALVNGKEVVVDREFLDNLLTDDYDRLRDYCRVKIARTPKQEEEKK